VKKPEYAVNKQMLVGDSHPLVPPEGDGWTLHSAVVSGAWLWAVWQRNIG